MQRDENHPRPQLTRAEWFDLGGTWGFAYDDANVGLREGWWSTPGPFQRTITVPFPPESSASGIADTSPHCVVWYRRGFRVPPGFAPYRWLLHFGAVDYRAQVWVNGQLVAWHEGGHTPFAADVTAALRHEPEEQVVVVRAEDEATELAQPRGKQHWEPEPAEIWFHRTTGIWQTVWLEPVPETHVADVRWTPDLDRGRLGLEVRLNQVPPRPLRVRLRLSLRGERLAEDSYVVDRREVHREVALAAPALGMGRQRLLWSPEHPNLIDAEMVLEEEGGSPAIDAVGSYVGLRSAGAANGRFLLNGQPYYLRMALAQGYWPRTHLAAPSNEALRREAELAKDLGFNGLRVHQKIEDPRFLFWCDKLGLLVWGEMPSAYAFSATAVERLMREWVEVLRRDYSHPCIVTWVPFNESWGVPNLERNPTEQHYVRSIYHLTHALDPTRPVIGNDGWEHFVSDVWGIHDYTLEGETIREQYGTGEDMERTLREHQPYFRALALPGSQRRGEPIVLTECGGIEHVPDLENVGDSPRRASGADDFVARYAELIDAILDCPTMHGFCYTELTDVEQEKVGLATAERIPKVDAAVIRAITGRPAKAVPAESLIGDLATEGAALQASAG